MFKFEMSEYSNTNTTIMYFYCECSNVSASSTYYLKFLLRPKSENFVDVLIFHLLKAYSSNTYPRG